MMLGWLYNSNFTEDWSYASDSVPTSTKSAGSILTSTTSLSTTSTSSSPEDKEEQEDSGVGGSG